MVSNRASCVFDRPGRDDRGWVLSVGHIAVVPLKRLTDRDAVNTRLVPAEAPGRLAFDHEEIINRALTDLRSRYRERPDPDHLLGETFTLRQRRCTRPSTGRRSVRTSSTPSGGGCRRSWFGCPAVRCGEGRGRPAQLFRRHEM